MQFERRGEKVFPRIHRAMKSLGTVRRITSACDVMGEQIDRAQRVEEMRLLASAGEPLFDRRTQLRIYRGDQ